MVRPDSYKTIYFVYVPPPFIICGWFPDDGYFHTQCTRSLFSRISKPKCSWRWSRMLDVLDKESFFLRFTNFRNGKNYSRVYCFILVWQFQEDWKYICFSESMQRAYYQRAESRSSPLLFSPKSLLRHAENIWVQTLILLLCEEKLTSVEMIRIWSFKKFDGTND